MDSKKFLAFWGWTSLPWNTPIGLDNLYWQEPTRIISSRLLLTLQKTASLLVLTSPPGHGKSTFARWLYHAIDQNRHDVAFFSLLQTEHKSGWLLPKLAQYLGMDANKSSARSVLVGLQESRLRGKILTIIIDDGHKLREPEAFDEILSLLQIQSIAINHVNFVVIGNPGLAPLIGNTEGAQHRLALFHEIAPLAATEIIDFANWRLRSVGINQSVLSSDALDLLRSLPPTGFAGIDGLLERSFVECFLQDQKIISAMMIQTASQIASMQGANLEHTRTGSKASRPASTRLKQAGKNPGKPDGQRASDLNSLYYKSGGGHDSDES